MTEPVAASEVDLDLPRHGGSYTRHVPVDGWVNVPANRLLEINILGVGGGVLASSQVEAGEETRGELHRIEAQVVLQALAEKEDACFELTVRGSTLRLPIVIGGANP